jgi:tetratricopeptide (TPR) repeat protein
MFRTVCSSSQAAGPSQTTTTTTTSSSSSSARTFRKLSQHSRHRFHRHKQNDFSVVVTSSSSSVEEDYQRINRREVTLSALLSTALAFVTGTASTKEAFAAGAVAKNSLTEEEIYDLQSVAADAYNRQDFTKAGEALTKLIENEPESASWLEGRAQVLVDQKQFKEAISDYTRCLEIIPAKDLGAEARLRAGRALAEEGIYQWEPALVDYNRALELATTAGFRPDPYVLNSRGNVRGSLNDWKGAKEDYEGAFAAFQSASGFRNGSSTTQRLDGAIYARSNAALATAELGDAESAIKELEGLVRRAPNSTDVRAALAALYWEQGKRESAEDLWNDACGLYFGCAQYKDLDFVRRIRRWPPSMVNRLENFLQVR